MAEAYDCDCFGPDADLIEEAPRDLVGAEADGPVGDRHGGSLKGEALCYPDSTGCAPGEWRTVPNAAGTGRKGGRRHAEDLISTVVGQPRACVGSSRDLRHADRYAV